MNFVEAYYSLDKSQLVFSFLSENRVDFRELARKLAQKYKTRIELRQIGVRDKSKKIGGLGPCGLFLCCNSFLTDFNSVSINMAKNQMLALNPSKINGICGRLLCCLSYENDTYSELKKNLPKLGSVVETPMGSGKVSSVNVLKNTYSVDLKEKGIVEFNGENNESTK
jgi:cell fate regulator YaaT (PSP1 superfamily)